MKVKAYQVHHLVKSEDLNHHGTLFAGRSAEWFVESGFIAAASTTNPKNIVCVKIHGMSFTRPIRKGEIICYESKIVLAGRSKLVSSIQVIIDGEPIVDGFITFVYVDDKGKASPHGLTLELEKPEDIKLNERAQALFK